jgi:hypothetical protein
MYRQTSNLRGERAASRCALLILALLTAGVGPPSAVARVGTPSFAVQTLDPLRTPYFAYDAQPGDTIRGQVRVLNTGTAAGAVRLDAVDATTGQTTGAVYRERRDPRRDVGAWITLSSHELRLGPREASVVAFSLAIPADAGGGQHLGGIVAENQALTNAPTARRDRGTFRVDIRTLTIVAVEADLPGPHVERLIVNRVSPSGTKGFQMLQVELINSGNRLLKGHGTLEITDADARRLKRIPFVVDTFLPHTAVSDPLPVPGRALNAGRYRAVITLTYGHGHHLRHVTTFAITALQVTQVFGSHEPPGAAARSSHVWPMGLAAGAASLLLGILFGSVTALRRRSSNY